MLWRCYNINRASSIVNFTLISKFWYVLVLSHTMSHLNLCSTRVETLGIHVETETPFSSLDPARRTIDSKFVIDEPLPRIKFMSTYCTITPKWIPQNTFYDKSALVQLMGLMPSSNKQLSEPTLNQFNGTIWRHKATMGLHIEAKTKWLQFSGRVQSTLSKPMVG